MLPPPSRPPFCKRTATIKRHNNNAAYGFKIILFSFDSPCSQNTPKIYPNIENSLFFPDILLDRSTSHAILSEYIIPSAFY